MEKLEHNCKDCDKSFEDLSDLIFHIKTVHRKKKIKSDQDFKCNICQKNFRYLCKIKEHINFFHVGDSDYKCSTCDKEFLTGFNLKRHKYTCEKLRNKR